VLASPWPVPHPQSVPHNPPRERSQQAPPLELLHAQRRPGGQWSLYVSRDRQLGCRGDLPNGSSHGAGPNGAGHHPKVVEALDVRDR
jgi:hypothetical protein